MPRNKLQHRRANKLLTINMFRFSYFVLVFVIIVNTGKGERNKVIVTVLYESECGDSRRFIEEQLNPTIQILNPYIKLNLVPFGKASSLNLNGEEVFRCQHGSSECLGNMVQSCALDLMQENSDIEKVNYVDCEMQTLAGTSGNMHCVLNSKLPAEEVKECIQSRKGVDLQLEAEFITKQVRPKFIPTIFINERFNQQVQDRALVNLERTLCSLIEDAPPCYKYFIRGSPNYDYYG